MPDAMDTHTPADPESLVNPNGNESWSVGDRADFQNHGYRGLRIMVIADCITA